MDFIVFKNFNRMYCNQTVKILIRCHIVTSDLGLHCLHLFQKKNARLIWVNIKIKQRKVESGLSGKNK